MKRIRRIGILLAAVTQIAISAGAQNAGAGDMPVKAAPRPPVYTWTGFYVGGGLGILSTQIEGTVTNFASAETTLAAFCAGTVALGGCVPKEPVNDMAFRFGPYAGFNWQVAPQWVVGIEGDFGFATKTTTVNGMFYPGTIAITSLRPDTFSVKTSWDASARGRIGYLVTPTFLVYATGGPAWLPVESTSNCETIPPGLCAPTFLSPAIITDSTTKSGWTIGGGIEAALWPNWIARAEYRYADFGTITHTDVRVGGPGVLGSPFTVTYDLAIRTHTATFGLAYKF